ncbi:hypothetical protein HK405_008287 [Cladochytrium tenue]|nr:hypothetical protein HK405_008287 [Cladochytrium tenue]
MHYTSIRNRFAQTLRYSTWLRDCSGWGRLPVHQRINCGHLVLSRLPIAISEVYTVRGQSMWTTSGILKPDTLVGGGQSMLNPAENDALNLNQKYDLRQEAALEKYYLNHKAAMEKYYLNHKAAMEKYYLNHKAAMENYYVNQKAAMETYVLYQKGAAERHAINQKAAALNEATIGAIKEANASRVGSLERDLSEREIDKTIYDEYVALRSHSGPRKFEKVHKIDVKKKTREIAWKEFLDKIKGIELHK